MSRHELVERVRDRLANSGTALDPAEVVRALREEGRPVGDAEALAVLDDLRRDVLGAGPLEPLLSAEGVTDVLVNGPGRVYVDRGGGARAHRCDVPRRRRRAPPRAATGVKGRTAAGRRDALRGPPAARRDPLPRGARAARQTRHRALAADPS